MAKKMAVIPLVEIDRIELYINTSKKSLDTLKKEKNFSYGINGGFYEFGSFTPNIHLKSNGKVYVQDEWTYWGYGWDNNDFKMMIVPNQNKLNYIACCELIVNGVKKPKLVYNKDVAGYRPRTAIGTKNGNMIMFASNDNMSPEQLRDYLFNQGLETAIMLDSGGSTQCNFNGDRIYSSRNVHNYILVYLKKENKPTTKNPYPIPTRTLTKGKIGNDVKWLQYQLNDILNSTLAIDGSFGPACYNEVIEFQKKYGLSADGSVGPATRTRIIELG